MRARWTAANRMLRLCAVTSRAGLNPSSYECMPIASWETYSDRRPATVTLPLKARYVPSLAKDAVRSSICIRVRKGSPSIELVIRLCSHSTGIAVCQHCLKMNGRPNVKLELEHRYYLI